MEINYKPQSVSIRSRPRDMMTTSNLDEKIQRYTTLKLQNMIQTSDNDFSPQCRTLAVEQIKSGIMSEQKQRDDSSKKIYSPQVETSEQRTNQTFFQHENSDYGIISMNKTKTPPEVVTGQFFGARLNSTASSQIDQLSFNGFSVKNAVNYKNNMNRRVIKGTSGLAVGSVIDCDTQEKLGQQVCDNMMGRVPNTVASDQTTHLPKQGQISIPASPNLAFDKRSQRSNLFSHNLVTEPDTLPSTVKMVLNPVTQSQALSNFRQPITSQSRFQDYQSDYHTLKVQNIVNSPRARTTGAHHRLHSNQQIRQLRERVTTQAAKSYEKQVERQNDQHWTHKAPLLQCAIQFNEIKQGVSRQKIVQKISEAKQVLPKCEEKPQSETKVDNFKRPSNAQSRKYQATERQIEETAKMIEEKAMLRNNEQLRMYLRGASKPKPAKSIQTSLLYTSATYKQLKKLEEEKNFVPLSVRFAKAFGTLFQQKQMIKIQDIIEKERRLKESMEAFAKTKISATTAVQNLTQDKQEQMILLLNRDRYWQDHDKEKQEELVKLVEQYCEKMYQNQNETGFDLLANEQQPTNFQYQSPRKLLSQMTFVGSPTQQQQTKRRNDLRNMSPQQRLREGLKKKVQKQITGKMSQGLAKFDEANSVNLFSMFIDQRNSQMSVGSQAHQVIDKLYFQQIGKKLKNSHLLQDDDFQKEAKIKFHEMCNEFHEVSMDILGHIQNQSLALQNYRLNPGQSQGIQKACQVDDELLQNLVIDNCGITDQSLAQIIDGLNNQRRVNSVSLRNSIIGLETSDKINQLLSRDLPYNIIELRIEWCDVSCDALTDILAALSKTYQLNKLVLVGLSFNEDQLNLLERFVGGAKYLMNLDLSWNRFKLQNFLPLFNTICASKRLQNLNLSWNSLVEFSNLGVVGSLCDDEKELSQRKTNQKRKLPEVKKVNKKLAEILGENQTRQKEFNQLERVVVEGLQQFISQNKKLMHLDLSDTGLTEDMILEIIKAVKYSQNLIGLHLSGNPGLSLAVEAKILSRMDATYERPHKLNSFFQHLNNVESPKAPSKENKSLIEAVFVKQVKQNRQAYYPTGIGQLDDTQRRHLILTRKLGHRPDIPGGKDWRAFTNSQEECYICDRKIYSLFVWSPEIGVIGDAEINLSDYQKHKIAKYILMNRETNLKREQQVQIDDVIVDEKHLPQRFEIKKSGADDLAASSDESQELSGDEESSHDLTSRTTTPIGKRSSQITQKLSGKLQTRLQNIQIQKQNTLVFDQKKKIRGRQVPLLYGSFNNWQAQPMIKVNHLAEYLLKDSPPDFLMKMKEDGYCDMDAKLEELNAKQLAIYNQQIEDYKTKFKDFVVWSRAIQNMIPYKHPHICGIDQMKLVEPKELYVSANFISCGKQNYAVTYNNQIYLHKTIADFRREEIVIPKLDGVDVGKVERNPNVFKNYVLDNPAIYENCSKYDFEGWKIQRFVKDPTEQAEIRRIVRREYAYLKDLFMHLASLSNYPGLSCLDFATFIEYLDIIGGPVSIGIIETQFIAARTDVENRGMKTYGQQSLDVNRFEFYEALIRVAGCVYKQQGLAATWNEAFTMLIQRIKEKYAFDTQQEFRDKLLYTREVNLTLDANKEGLLEVYDLYVSKKQQRVSMQSCLKLLTKDTSIKLSERDAIACFGLCQMTCPDLVKNSFLCVGHITFIEFLELVGRAADSYFSDLDAPLEVKINYILDAWLQLVDRQREESQYFEEGVFDESDQEADSIAQKQLLRLRLSKKLDQTVLSV